MAKLPKSGMLVLMMLSMCAIAYVPFPGSTESTTDNCVARCEPDCELRCKKIKMLEGNLVASCEISSPRNSATDRCVCADLPDQPTKQAYYHYIAVCNEEPMMFLTTAYKKMFAIGVITVLHLIVALYLPKTPATAVSAS